jgi:hypothetical protein
MNDKIEYIDFEGTYLNWRNEAVEQVKKCIKTQRDQEKGVVVILYNPQEQKINYKVCRDYEDADKRMFEVAKDPLFVLCHTFEMFEIGK